MEPRCISYKELGGASKLFSDYLYDFEKVSSFYTAPPGEYASVAGKIQLSGERRAALVSALEEQNPDSPLLAKLGRAGTVAVVTGQQAGLFSGPCYTVYKALTAIKLAAELSETGIPAVPVFWMATEDHDFEEVRYCWTFDAAMSPGKLEVAAEGTRPRPVGPVKLVNPPLNELRSALSGLPYGDEIATLVEVSYAPGKTFGEAFQEILQRILGEHSILFLDPLQPAIRELVAPLLREALLRHDELKRDLLERNKELNGAGYHDQVHVDQNSSLLFHLRDGLRAPLELGNGVEELAERAGELSPNALLRPVIQDSFLPTVAYVGGPAELAYFAQSQVLFRSLLGRMPVAVPRAAFTVLDHRAGKLMGRYGLDFLTLRKGRQDVGDRIARSLTPPELNRAFEESGGQVAGGIEALRPRVKEFDPTLAAALEKSGAKIRYQLEKIQRKASAEAMRRSERAHVEADYLANLAFPHRHPQERFYTILPLLAQHGLDLVDRVYERIDLRCADHQVLAA